MNKSYAESYLMTKSKKTLIEYLRTSERNRKTLEEMINQMTANFNKLLEQEKTEVINKFAEKICSYLEESDDITLDDILILAEELKTQECD